MSKTCIDQLNKLLTNTVEYKKFCSAIISSIDHDETIAKLQELSEVADNEILRLMKTIEEEGGHVDSTERQTDHHAISWVAEENPNMDSMQSIVKCLANAESKKIEDYKTISKLSDKCTNTEKTLSSHLIQAEATSKYLQAANQTLEKKS